jgi:hypothetical protein
MGESPYRASGLMSDKKTETSPVSNLAGLVFISGKGWLET